MTPDAQHRRASAYRRRAERRGRIAETIARLLLNLKGYRIVASRLRTPVGEIDLLARRGGVLAVVEVKTRPTLADAGDAVSYAQRHRLARAAVAVLAGRTDLAGLTVRFDAVLVPRRGWPRHLPDAWRP
ncbi:MAG TPA: YraN family protein [Azospirillaceae bacterium]|nr:YraN family protein [Azospirillaceae bacterium]